MKNIRHGKADCLPFRLAAILLYSWMHFRRNRYEIHGKSKACVKEVGCIGGSENTKLCIDVAAPNRNMARTYSRKAV
jgi:hypothetical protein